MTGQLNSIKINLVPTFHYDLAYLMSFEEYLPRLKHIFTEVDCLNGETGGEVEVLENTLRFQMNPFEIKTIRLCLENA